MRCIIKAVVCYHGAVNFTSANTNDLFWGVESMNLQSLDHVAITVRDLEGSLTWYSHTLGFQLYHKWDETWMIERDGIKIGMFLRSTANPVDDVDNKMPSSTLPSG